MKLLISLLLIFFAHNVSALTCAKYKPPNGEKLEVINDQGVFYFSVPKVLEGKQVRSIKLFVYPLDAKQEGELLVPVAYTIEGGFAKGHFAITSKWVEAELSASYTKEMCGPRLIANVRI